MGEGKKGVSAEPSSNKEGAKGEPCKNSSREGIEGSKRNGIDNRPTLNGIRVSGKVSWKEPGFPFEWVLKVLVGGRAAVLLPLNQISTQNKKVQEGPHQLMKL